MRCSTCGYESPVPGQFCSQCGAVLVTVTAQPGPVNAYDPPKTLSFADATMTAGWHW